MTSGGLIYLAVTLLAVLAGFVWVAFELRNVQSGTPGRRGAKTASDAYIDTAKEDIDHLFNKEFREELRNRGILRFEKIINENAMFLKQDLDLTGSQINEYLKKEISKNLQTEFVAYSQAMQDAQQLALTSLHKTAADVEEQRMAMTAALQADIDKQKEKLLQMFETNMATIVEHYVLETLGNQFDLKSQLPYILEQMEASKADIVKDMRL